MHSITVLNSKRGVMKTIDVSSEGLQYGYGAFETILVKNSVVYDFDAHFNRLQSAMVYLNMDFKVQMEELYISAREYLEKEERINGVLKISCFLNKNKTEIVFTSRDFPYSDKCYDDGYKICTSKIKRHSDNPIHMIKSNNVINNHLEMQKIKKDGFNESIHLNQNNNITEGVYSNIFFVKDNILFTPDIRTGLLPGIQRQKVINVSKKIGIRADIGYYTIEDIKNADEVFLTSSLLGIIKVTSFENTRYCARTYSVMDRIIKEML